MNSRFGYYALILIVLLSACGPAPAANTQGSAAVPTDIPATAAILPTAAETMVPSATSVPSATPAPTLPQTIKYFVKAGETCSMIAVAHKISLDQLAQVNPGYKCSGIKEGDILTILVLSSEDLPNTNQAQLNSVATAVIQPTKALVVPTAKPVQVQPTAKPIPTAAPAPTKAAGNCSPAYPGVCIPPPPPDLDCKDVPFRRFKVLAPDPHRFDSDKDGIGCES